MNADIQYVAQILKASRYYKWAQSVIDGEPVGANLWEKGNHARLYIKAGDSQLGYFDLINDKYVGSNEAYANQIVAQIAAEERGSLESLEELLEDEALPEPAVAESESPKAEKQSRRGEPDGMIEWLKSKSEAEQLQLMTDDDTPYGWMNSYPRVSAEEAQALREGKPYELKHFDIERLSQSTWIGCDGSPDTDPFIIKMLAKGYLMENPRYTEDKARKAAQIASLIATDGPGEYTVGVGDLPRWRATESGKAFARKVLGVDFVDWK